MSPTAPDPTALVLHRAIDALKWLQSDPQLDVLASTTTETSESTEESESTEATETTEHSENKEGKEGTEDSEGSEDSENSESTENSEDTENSESTENSEDTENQEGLLNDVYAPLVLPGRGEWGARPDYAEYKDLLKRLADVLETRLSRS